MDQDEQQKQTTAGVFGRAADTYDTIEPHFFARFGARLVEVANPLPGARVLDVAAGRGAVLFPAAQRVGLEGAVMGVDLSERMVSLTRAEIRQRGVSNATMQQMDAEALEMADNSFDCLFCSFALFFFPDVRSTLTGFRRVLKPGGILAVSTWDSGDASWAWMEEALKPYQTASTVAGTRASDGIEFHTEAGMTMLLEAVGFQNVSVVFERSTLVYPSVEAWWASLWSHGMRARLEQLTSEQLTEFKAESFRRIEANRCGRGICEQVGVLYTLALAPVD